MKPISTKAHGVLDLLTAGTLLTLPRMLGWSEKVTQTMTGAALGTLGYSLLTRYEWGLIKLLPMKAHLVLDGMSGALFCTSPLMFPEEDTEVTNTLVGIGLFELGAAFLTEPEPSLHTDGRRLADTMGRSYQRLSDDFGDQTRRSSTAARL